MNCCSLRVLRRRLMLSRTKPPIPNRISDRPAAGPVQSCERARDSLRRMQRIARHLGARALILSCQPTESLILFRYGRLVLLNIRRRRKTA